MSDSSPVRKKKRPCVGSSHRAQVLQDEAQKELISDLRRMVNQDNCSDVVFICKDERRVKASRSLLIGRCNVMKGMLTNGMKETYLSEINLPGVSSQALSSVFEFLYSGAILDSQLKGWRLLFDVVVAARFFLLPCLVSIAVELIQDNISEIAKDLSEVAAMLTVSLELRHSFEENEWDVIKRKLIGLLSSNWTHSVYAANLSEEALYYLLSRTKAEDNYQQVADKNISIATARPRKQKVEPSLTEYYRFRQVILWWAYQNVPGWSRQVEEKVESAVPLIRDTSNLYFNVGIDDKTDSSLGLKSLLNASRGAARRLLSAIDLRNMHLILLENVVEPLNCFPFSDIMRVFRFHALDKFERSIKFSNAKCDWKHGKSLKIRGYRGESFVQKSGPDGGAAIALIRMSSKTRIHLWRFVIEEELYPFVEMGFVFANADQGFEWDENNLDRKFLQQLPGTRSLVLSASHRVAVILDRKSHRREPIDKVSLKGSQVLFRLDFVEHNCSVSLDGKDFGICWENLPDRDCYPAVSLMRHKSSSTYPEPNSGLVAIQTPKM